MLLSPQPAPLSEQGDQAETLGPSVWQQLRNGPLKVALLGSGNWGTTIAKIMATNVQRSYIFQKEIKMYVHEETVHGRKLTEIINNDHENPKYLPGIKLPSNIVATPSSLEAAKDAHIVVFAMPHQFLPAILRTIQGKLLPGAKGISLIKGFEIEEDDIVLPSDYIRKKLGIECCVLSGANVAKDIAEEQFAEATIGYSNIESARLYQQLFDTPYFKINCVRDSSGVEICGALKNVVALAAGFCDGMGLGTNTKAAILRIGMAEMRKFAVLFGRQVVEDTFWDSCGIADVITTSFGGRNRKCAAEFVRTREPWPVLEQRMLDGQKLQGTLTAKDVHGFLKSRNMLKEFPLFATVHRIAYEDADAKELIRVFMLDAPRPIRSTQILSKL